MACTYSGLLSYSILVILKPDCAFRAQYILNLLVKTIVYRYVVSLDASQH